MFTGVDRSYPCDIAGPAGAVGREAAGLRVGGGRAAAQLRRRDQAGPAEAVDGRGVRPPGGGHVRHNGVGRVRQAVYGRGGGDGDGRDRRGRGGRLAAADHHVGPGHPEEHSRHPQAADQHGGRLDGGGRRATATERRFVAKRPGRRGRCQVERSGQLVRTACTRRPTGACSTRVFFLKTETINVYILFSRIYYYSLVQVFFCKPCTLPPCHILVP